MKALFFSLSLLTTSLSLAQLDYRGELEFTADVATAVGSPEPSERVGWLLAAHLEADYPFGPLVFNLELDPYIRISEEATGELGLTEAYLATQQDEVSLRIGRERLPLEYARLTLPYTVEPINPRGVRLGVPGVQAVWYPEDYRVRGAVFYRDTLIPLLSVRRSFGSFELEATALYQDRFIAGLGGSGAVGNLVVYGEGWLLTRPVEARGAFGVTGSIRNRLWILEAAYAPLEPDALAPDPGPAASRVAGRIILLQDEDLNLDLEARVGFLDIGVVFSPRLGYTAPGDEVFTASFGGRFSREVPSFDLILSIRTFF